MSALSATASKDKLFQLLVKDTNNFKLLDDCLDEVTTKSSHITKYPIPPPPSCPLITPFQYTSSSSLKVQPSHTTTTNNNNTNKKRIKEIEEDSEPYNVLFSKTPSTAALLMKNKSDAFGDISNISKHCDLLLANGRYIIFNIGLFLVKLLDESRIGNKEERYTKINKLAAQFAPRIKYDFCFPYGYYSSEGREVLKRLSEQDISFRTPTEFAEFLEENIPKITVNNIPILLNKSDKDWSIKKYIVLWNQALSTLGCTKITLGEEDFAAISYFLTYIFKY